MELTSFKFNGVNYQLTPNNTNECTNKFTLLLGENGSGKSEAIREMINILLRMQVTDVENSKHLDILDSYLENRYKSTLRDRNTSVSAELSFNGSVISASFSKTNEDRIIVNFKGEPEFLKENSYRYHFNIDTIISNKELAKHIKSINIVAVSESPYIKFPITQSDNVLNYSYVGKKQEQDYEYMSPSSDDYVDAKVEQLTKSIFQTITESKEVNVSHVLDFLSLGKNLSLKIKIKSKYLHQLNETSNLIDNIFNFSSRFTSLGNENYNQNKKEDREKLTQAINYMKTNLEFESNNTFNSNFSTEAKELSIDITEDSILADHISILLRYNLINILKLKLNHGNHEIDVIQLSSGQLCILNNIFGVASRISNNSFVFIDEPEISLHPSWQAAFIRLLEQSFSSYKGCHFIIATHSPHIVSNINENNSYVVPMDKQGPNAVTERYDCQGWTVDEILKDIMGMDETRSELYNDLIKSFNYALDDNNAKAAKNVFEKLSIILHPENVLTKVLEIQMIGVGDHD